MALSAQKEEDVDRGHRLRSGRVEEESAPRNKDQLQTPERKGGDGEDADPCFYLL